VKEQETRIHSMTGQAITILILALMVCLITPREANALKESRRAQVRRQIHEVKTWEMTKELGLDEEQARIFFPAMEDYEGNRDRLRDKRAGVESTLDSLLGAGGARADREILKNLESLKLIDREQTAHEDEYQRQLSRVLSPQQRARYELFERKFEARLREMIREVQREDKNSAGQGSHRSKLEDSTSPKKADRSSDGAGKTKKKKTKRELDKKEKSEEKSDSRKSKSRTGDKDRDKSDSKKSSEDRPSRGSGASRNLQNRTEGPELPRRGI
jgi:hypothetical protein